MVSSGINNNYPKISVKEEKESFNGTTLDSMFRSHANMTHPQTLNQASSFSSSSMSSIPSYQEHQQNGNGYFGPDSVLFGPFADVARTVAAISAYSDRNTSGEWNANAIPSSTSSSSVANSSSVKTDSSASTYGHSSEQPHLFQPKSLQSSTSCHYFSDTEVGLGLGRHGLFSSTDSQYFDYENSPLALILAASSIRETDRERGNGRGSFDLGCKAETASTDSNNESVSGVTDDNNSSSTNSNTNSGRDFVDLQRSFLFGESGRSAAGNNGGSSDSDSNSIPTVSDSSSATSCNPTFSPSINGAKRLTLSNSDLSIHPLTSEGMSNTDLRRRE